MLLVFLMLCSISSSVLLWVRVAAVQNRVRLDRAAYMNAVYQIEQEMWYQ